MRGRVPARIVVGQLAPSVEAGSVNQTVALICACAWDAQGNAREVGWQEIDAWRPGSGSIWIHLDRTVSETRTWLESRSGLDAITCEALLAEETRPRSLTLGDALLVILRGVNLNPGAD